MSRSPVCEDIDDCSLMFRILLAGGLLRTSCCWELFHEDFAERYTLLKRPILLQLLHCGILAGHIWRCSNENGAPHLGHGLLFGAPHLRHGSRCPFLWRESYLLLRLRALKASLLLIMLVAIYEGNWTVQMGPPPMRPSVAC